MKRLVLVAGVGMALALPGGIAVAASPVPGAHYEGTTDDSAPLSFDVSPDGTTLTNVVTTAFAFCTNGQPSQYLASNSSFAFPIAGGAISGEDTVAPYLKMAGTFSSPSDASGTLSMSSGGFYGGTPYFCNAIDRPWTAHTTAAVPGGGGGGGTPGGGDGAPAGGAPSLSISFPRGVLLQPSLKNGFVVSISVDQPSRLTGSVSLKARDAKRYGLGKRTRVIARASEQADGIDDGLEFKPKRSVARKLRKAKKLNLLLTVKATNAAGQSSKAKKTLAFK